MSQTPFFDTQCGSLRRASLLQLQPWRCAMKRELRTRSVGTNVSEAELRVLEARSAVIRDYRVVNVYRGSMARIRDSVCALY
jgi:hypothetical protein